MEYLGLFIFLGIICFLFYLAIKDERKKIAAIIAREKAQADLMESICSFIEHKNIRIYWDSLRAAEDDLEVVEDGR